MAMLVAVVLLAPVVVLALVLAMERVESLLDDGSAARVRASRAHASGATGADDQVPIGP